MKVFRPLRSKPKRYSFVGVDTEDDSAGNVHFVSVAGESGEGLFEDRAAAIGYLHELAQRDENVRFVCHNLEYDIVNLFWGSPLFDRASLWFSGAGLVMADVAGMRFIDSYRHAPFPLAKLGDIVGIEKLQFDPHDPEYALNDARIVYRYMEHAQEEYNELGAEAKGTVPATALDLYRRKYMKHALPIFDEDVVEWFRSGYFGGRTECFRIGEVEGDLRIYDVNSMYPFVMQGEFPDLWKLKRRSRPSIDGFGMVEARVRVPEGERFPLLPVRVRGKLVFPVGTFKGVYTTVELREAVKAGYDVEPIYGWVTDEYVYPFRSYVSDLYRMRREAKANKEIVKDTIYKLLMNSLYGKFGAGKSFVALVDSSDLIDGVRVIECFGDKAMVMADEKYPPYANAIWAAWVTALSRIVLWRYLNQLSEYGEVLYCDTDSVMIRVDREPPFGASVELGDLAFEKSAERAEIRLPKVYRFGDTFKAKGARNAKAFLEEGFETSKAPVRLREGIRRGLRPNVWIEKVKRLKGSYDKRIVHENGSTEPLRLPI